MKKNIIKLFLFAFIVFFNVNAFSQKTVLVTEDNFSALGWQKAQINTDPSGAPPIRKFTSDFVYINCGLDNLTSPPTKLTMGGVYMTYPNKTEDPALPSLAKESTLDRILLLNDSYSDTKLTDITELKYSTYTVGTPLNTPDASGVSVHPCVAPMLLLQIDMGDGQINNINFQPNRQTIFTSTGVIYPVVPDTWQEWDALALRGKWFFFNRTGGNYDLPATFSFDFFRTKYPDAKIINKDFFSPYGGAGIRFIIGNLPQGYYDDFRGYIDAFRIKTPSTVVLPPSSPGAGGGDLLYDFDGECKKNVVIPHVVKPPWPLYRNPIFISSIIGLVILTGYFIYRKTRSNNK